MKNISYTLSLVIVLFSLFHPQVAESGGNKARAIFQDITVSNMVTSTMNSKLDKGRLLTQLRESLQNSGKIEIVTRDSKVMLAIRKEQLFSQSDLSAGDAAFEGNFSNADYIISPEVTVFRLYRNYKDVPNLPGKYRRWDAGELQLTAKIYNTVTAKEHSISGKASFKTELELTSKKEGAPPKSHFNRMAEKIANQFTDRIVDTLFPMKVLKNDGKQVWINRGEDGGLKKNQILNIYSPGEELIDPDTGENLGSAEAYFGKIKVIRVNPKFTVATIENKSNASEITKGFIVRKPN